MENITCEFRHFGNSNEEIEKLFQLKVYTIRKALNLLDHEGRQAEVQVVARSDNNSMDISVFVESKNEIHKRRIDDIVDYFQGTYYL